MIITAPNTSLQPFGFAQDRLPRSSASPPRSPLSAQTLGDMTRGAAAWLIGTLLIAAVNLPQSALAQTQTTWQEDYQEARKLLASPQETKQQLALEKLWKIDRKLWLTDDSVVDRLRELLASQTTWPNLKPSILWLFRNAEAFDRVEEAAQRLVRESDEPLARAAAGALVYEDSWEPVSEELRCLFLTSRGVLRQEAAISIGKHWRPELDVVLEAAVIEELIGTFEDDSVSALARGEAIRAAASFVGDPYMEAALLSMLSRERWFFSVQGEHYLLSSLVPLIDTLGFSKSAEVRETVLRLKGVIDQVPESQRWDVDVSLNFFARNR